ncbi:MAG TPA: type II toxin-antitoxin system VapC family toxin [Acidobacteriaceae bacterium]|nr:type II toxin-antitoxin system VapC family toxin [Acidobacteriaceae bacterium]
MKADYLLDTHILLWLDSDVRRVSTSVIETIDRADQVYYSAASVWELSIKQSLGKLRLTKPISGFVENSRFLELPVTTRYAEAAAKLPMHHRDPFDRMLVAQAGTEGLVLITADERLSAYDLKTLRV